MNLEPRTRLTTPQAAWALTRAAHEDPQTGIPVIGYITASGAGTMDLDYATSLLADAEVFWTAPGEVTDGHELVMLTRAREIRFSAARPQTDGAEARVAATVDEIYRMLMDDEMTVKQAGALLVTLEPDRHIHAHPDEQSTDVHGQDAWTDENGRRWPLDATYRTIDGQEWHYAGGFDFIGDDGDKQPLMSTANYSQKDVPLAYVRAVYGPLAGQ